MRPEIERIRQKIRNGDISQDMLDELARAVPTDDDYEDIFGDAPEELDSFQEVAGQILQLESFIKKPKVEELKPAVRFIDYDGTVIKSVELNELPLKELPKSPNHANDLIPITFTGWTSTLEQVNSAKNSLDVGAQYKSVDGDTHLAIHVSQTSIDAGGNEVTIQVIPIAEDILVDFGDGTTTTISAYVADENDENATGPEAVSVTNTYTIAGEYDIRISTEAQNYELTMWCTPEAKFYGLVIGDNVQTTGTRAFNTCRSLRSIIIPESMQSIGEYSFSSCKSLSTLIIPNGIQEIKSYAFNDCEGLHNLIIGNDVVSIEGSVFSSCRDLWNLTIGNSVQTIGGGALSYSQSLHSLVIPDSVENIGSNVFCNCYSLENLVLGNSVQTIGNSAFSYCNALKSLVLPASVQTIGSYAFRNCESLHDLIIEDGAQSIANDAFYGCSSLRNLVIPDSVQTIGNNAFYECFSLKKLVIPDSVQTIGDNAFYNCYSLDSLVIPDSVQTIGGYAFYNCYSLDSLVIPDSVQTIGSYAFNYCYSLRSLVIGNGLQLIASNTFAYCYSLKELVIPDSVQWIASWAFQNCYALENLVIGNGVHAIPTFAGCYSLRNLVIGSSVEDLNYAFQNCASLESVVIPDSVQTITNSFTNCYSLQNLVIGSGVQSITGQSFSECRSLQKAYIKQAMGTLDLVSTELLNTDIEWGYGMDIMGFSISNSKAVVGEDTHIKIDYLYQNAEEGDQIFTKGNYELTCSDNATITNGWLHLLSDSGTVTVTATSTDDPTYSVTKEITIIQPSVTVDLNNGQWVDANEVVDGHTVYKSDAGSYNISNGTSVCTVDAIGYKTLTIWIKNGSNDKWNDFVVLGGLNQTVTRSSYKYRETDASYFSYSYKLDKRNHNTVQIMYTKNASTNSGTDRGYFYYTVE